MRRIRRSAAVILAAVGLLLLAAYPAPGAASDHSGEKAILLLVDRLGVEPLFDNTSAYPNLARVASQGAPALMNVRTGGGSLSGAGYLSLAAGRRMFADDPVAGLAFNVNEHYLNLSAASHFRTLSREDLAGDIVHLGAGALRDRPDAAPVLLGDVLRRFERRTAAIGNGDVEGHYRRFGALVAMTSIGEVDWGDVSAGVSQSDPTWPFGLRTDYRAMWKAFADAYPLSDFIVIDLPDLARLEERNELLGPTRLAYWKHEALLRIDAFLGRILDYVGQDPAILVVTAPSPPMAEAAKGHYMTPVLYIDSQSPGQRRLLTSPTTRRPGLITAADIAPTILAHFDIEGPASMPGRPVHTTGLKPGTAATSTSFLRSFYRQVVRTHEQRLPVIQAYFLAQLVVLLVSAGLLFFKPGFLGQHPLFRTVWLHAHLGLVSFPLVVLVQPLLPPGNLILTGAEVLGLTAIISAAAGLMAKRPLMPFASVALATAALIATDLFLGAPLLKASLLGYDPLGGARFYGIGNEYMGVFIGATLLGVMGFVDLTSLNRLRRPVMAGASLVLLIFLAEPDLGINFGGTLAAIAAVGTLWSLSAVPRFSWRWGAVATAAAAAVAFVLLGPDILGAAPGASHVGEAVRSLSDQGPDPFWNIVERKVAMNLKLIRLTIWSRAMLVSLGLTGYFLFKPTRLMQRFSRRYPQLALGIRTAFVAAVVALVANDSGVVAAATMMIPVAPTLLYLLQLLEREKSPNSTFTPWP